MHIHTNAQHQVNILHIPRPCVSGPGSGGWELFWSLLWQLPGGGDVVHPFSGYLASGRQACSVSKPSNSWFPVEGLADICQCCSKGDCGTPSHVWRQPHVVSLGSSSSTRNCRHVTEEVDITVGPLIFLDTTGDHEMEQWALPADISLLLLGTGLAVVAFLTLTAVILVLTRRCRTASHHPVSAPNKRRKQLKKKKKKKWMDRMDSPGWTAGNFCLYLVADAVGLGMFASPAEPFSHSLAADGGQKPLEPRERGHVPMKSRYTGEGTRP
ncbi:uncharacterized protein LOC116537718 [Sapajus apella]|uniref:Uncharacterized protein LOC116537718 n=1 Tax=Sapajus apella TaxID=9515 RepID=A0A6J3GDC2_SAPAP|nr:uncharacterized protein LOC116537718 [Sapajus apella]